MKRAEKGEEKIFRNRFCAVVSFIFSSVSLKKKMWILNDLFVHENYRRQGVAEALIEKSRELAVETKSKGLVLETHSSNFEAQKLYNKTGFEQNDEFYTFI